MKIKALVNLIALSLLVFLNSCVSQKEMTYLRYSDKSANTFGIDNQMAVTPYEYKVMPYDNLLIRIITPDPQWSELFNMNVGPGGLTQESAALSGYNVDGSGKIEIPFVGKITASGRTLSEIKVELDSVFKNFVTDAAISIRLVNNFVSVIGEVRAPGRYTLTKDRISIFEALSMAGDISEYGNHKKVQLIRPSPYGPVIKELALTDRSILSSEYYYVMPNDIIYCMPVRARSFQVNSTPITLVLSTVSTALLLISYFRTL